VLVLTTLLLPGAQCAGTISYTYTGNDFTNAVPPYTISDSITIKLTLAAPLGDNLNLQLVTPLTVAFSDGDLKDDQSTIDSALYAFSTDSQSDITGWEVILDLSDGVVLAAYDTHTVYDFARLGETSTEAYIEHTPGRWSDPPSGVPEPASTAMMICGALLFIGWKGFSRMARQRAVGPAAAV
jgi:hypothetical protein